MKKLLFVAALLSIPFSAMAASKFTTAKITKVEAWYTGSSSGVNFWLERISGDELPTGASGNFGLTDKTRLVLTDATGTSGVEARKHMLSVALTAYSTGTTMRFYWNDADHQIIGLMSEL